MVNYRTMIYFIKEKHLLLLFFLVLIVAVNAQNFVINSTIDAVDSNPGNGICDDGLGNCPLRAAIQESNALGGAHTITLPAGIYTLTIGGVGENASATGDLDVTSNITINGATPSSSIIDVNSIDRGFHLLSTGQLTILNITIKNGNTLRDHGGGILNQGTLFINYCHITENISTLPVGATYSGGFGGGIANFGNLIIENSTLFLNEAIGGRGTNGQNGGGGGGSTPGFGGAIYNNSNGVITLENSTISNNIAFGGKYSSGSTDGGNFTFAGKRGAGPLGGNGGAAGGGAGSNGGIAQDSLGHEWELYKKQKEQASAANRVKAACTGCLCRLCRCCRARAGREDGGLARLRSQQRSKKNRDRKAVRPSNFPFEPFKAQIKADNLEPIYVNNVDRIHLPVAKKIAIRIFCWSILSCIGL